MSKKAANKIINNNIVKTINVVNGYYLIVDNILYSVDYDNLAVQSKQELPEYLDRAELKNKVLSSNFFEQISLYFKDNFQISNITVDSEQLKVSLSNNIASANLTYCFYDVEPKAFLSCIASKFEQKAKVKKVVTVESLQEKIKGLQAKIRVLTFKINSLPVDSVLIPELQDKLHILKSKIKDLQFKIDFMLQKEKNKATQPESEKSMEMKKENLQPKFCFIQFAIYYLIANLEQDNQAEKPTKNLLPVLYAAKQKTQKEIKREVAEKEKRVKQILIDNKIKTVCDRVLSNLKALEYDLVMRISAIKKTTVKTTLKPLQIEFKKQVLYLPCKTVYLLPAPVVTKKPVNKDHFADFEVKYLEKVREKKRYRKQNSKFAGILNEIGKFSSVACLIFLFLNSFVMIQKSNETFQNLAKVENKTEVKQEFAKESIKTMSNLSDNGLSGTSYHPDNKTAKNGTFDGLNLISLVMLTGIVNNKRRLKKQIKEQLKTYSLVVPELENTIFAKRKVKDKIRSIGKRITLINKYF